MTIFIDPRSAQVVSGDQFNSSVGGIINQILARKAQKKALAGDDSAMANLASRDVNRASAVGSILRNNEQSSMIQSQEAEKQMQQRREMQARIAKGFQAATDKKQYLLSAQNALRQNGLGMMADELTDEIERFDVDPHGVSQEFDRAVQFFSDPSKNQEISAIQSRNDLVSRLKSDDETIRKQAEIEAGFEPRAVGSSEQTITEKGIVDKIGETKSQLKEAETTGELKARLIYEPKIKDAVKAAETAAQERGEVITDLERAEAALPGLSDAIEELKELAQIATSTLGGRAFDVMVKELGFGATKGSTARAKYSSIVRNQLFPLLKQTFGSAFTQVEGEKLEATLGDINASPTEKIAQLESFLEQKYRDIRTKKKQLGVKEEAPQPANIGRFKVKVIN